MTKAFSTPLHRVVAALGTAGLLGNALAATVIALPLLVIATPVQAACTNQSGSTQNRTFTYTAANIANEAKLDFPSTIQCTGFLDGRNLCIGTKYTRTVVSGANTAVMRVDFVDSTHGAGVTDMNATGAMYGPYGGILALGPSTTSVTVSAVVPANGVAAKPAGTYSRTFEIYMDMAASVFCDIYGFNVGDFAHGNYTAHFVVPNICTLVSSPTINFGPVSSVGPTASRVDAQGSVTVKCNSPYTIYIGDGGDRIATGSRHRQMAQGGHRLPYQLYKDSGRSQVWDATGGTASINGSGGVSDTGTSVNQTKTVYASIPVATTLPVAGAYSDTVIVTVTY